jgi:signal transduction histidine kinase
VNPRSPRPLPIALGWNIPGWLLDIGPVAFIGLVGLGQLVVERGQGSGNWASALALVVMIVALLYRHRSPMVTLGVILVFDLVLGDHAFVMLPLLLAIFTVAEYEGRTQTLLAAGLTAIVCIASPIIHGNPTGSWSGVILSRLIAVGLAAALGLYLRARADYVTGLTERAERLERERELLAQQAVADERLRIARELHDVVAHNVSLMVVQSQALAATSGQSAHGDEAASQQTLHSVADLGRDALSEMHRMLGVLRVAEGGEPEREPQPGVRDLEALIARTSAAGLDARLIVEGHPRELPAGVDLSAYRIVQEALTNVIRHAEAEHAIVRLSYSGDGVQLSVEDDGHAPPNGSAVGHGMVGMRERVALFGGQLSAGRRTDGPGFRVTASLPLR